MRHAQQAAEKGLAADETDKINPSSLFSIGLNPRLSAARYVLAFFRNLSSVRHMWRELRVCRVETLLDA
jgi:hypothetical protein